MYGISPAMLIWFFVGKVSAPSLLQDPDFQMMPNAYFLPELIIFPKKSRLFTHQNF